MSDYVRWVVGAVLVLTVGFGVWGYLEAREADERERELVERVDSLKGEVAAKDSALAAVDSAARARIAGLRDSVRVYQRQAAQADTQFVTISDTLLAAVPDTLRGLVNRMREAHRTTVDRMNGHITSLNGIIAEKDAQISARDSLIRSLRDANAAQDTLVAHLRERLHPGFWEGLAGDLPETLGKVGAGVILGAVLIN